MVREPERVLSDRDRRIFEKAVALRSQRRPLAYITGERGFYGRSFKINRAVLIPRWETELLVTRTLDCVERVISPRIADIGTGSGCIAVTLACERKDIQVWATDISENALLLARKNVTRFRVQKSVELLEGDLLSPLPEGLAFDAIVSNPPYVSIGDLPTLQPEVRSYEPREALTGVDDAAGEDGTALYPRLFTEAWPFLKAAGWILVEIGAGQAERVSAIAEEAGYGNIRITEDLAGIPRVVEAQKPS
jgi:release factor glutamine methyltransferase